MEVLTIPNPSALRTGATASENTDIRLLFHFPGQIVRMRDGAYYSDEGIPRVMRQRTGEGVTLAAYA